MAKCETTATEDDPTGAASCTRPGPAIAPLTSPRSGSSAARPRWPHQRLRGQRKSPGQTRWPSSGTPQVPAMAAAVARASTSVTVRSVRTAPACWAQVSSFSAADATARSSHDGAERTSQKVVPALAVSGDARAGTRSRSAKFHAKRLRPARVRRALGAVNPRYWRSASRYRRVTVPRRGRGRRAPRRSARS